MTENTIIWNTYSLIEVETAEDKTLFHRVMDCVYADDPDFIYPLENDVEGVFELSSSPVKPTQPRKFFFSAIF